MISQQLRSLIHQIEITTRKKVSGPLIGGARSSVRGLGFEFNQLREYIPGDDIRFIDWKSSARSSKILVREYLEDRNRTLYILVDISASTTFGTVKNEAGQPLTKADLVKQLAAVLAFSSLHLQDSVGLILFSERIEKFIPARRSRNHVLALVQTLFTHKAQMETTNLSVPLEYIARLKGQKAIVCLISDFIAPLDKKILSVASRHHDLMALRCLDVREKSFPEVGTLVIEDSETHIQVPIAGAYTINNDLNAWHERQRDQLISARIDTLDCEVGVPFTGPLLQFLRYRVYG
jgi:uncharacterized protein (DUF58 family)